MVASKAYMSADKMELAMDRLSVVLKAVSTAVLKAAIMAALKAPRMDLTMERKKGTLLDYLMAILTVQQKDI